MDLSNTSSAGSAGIMGQPAVALFKRARFLAVAGLMVALLFALACSAQQAAAPAGEQSPAGGQPKYGGILKLHWVGGAPSDLDVLTGCASICSARISPVYSQLVRYDPPKSAEEAVIMPDLAERWDYSADGKTLTFHLQKNAKWDDGVPVTSADVKYTFDRWLDPKDPLASKFSGTREALADIDSVEAVDNNTVRFYLKLPSNGLLPYLAQGSRFIVPKHAWPTMDPAKDMNGSGPFRLKSYQPGVSIEYEKNPNYFVKDKPYLDGVIDYFLKDNATRVAAFTTGQIDMLRFIDQPMWDQIHKDDPQAVLVPWNALRATLLQTNMARKPFEDPRVRKAIFMALDRQEGSKIIAGDWGAIGGYITAGPWALPAAELKTMPGYGDPKAQAAEAKQLLAQAGYPDGFKAELLLSANNTLYETTAVWVKDQLKKNLNIDVTLNVRQPAQYSTAFRAGDFDLWVHTSPASYPDPTGHPSTITWGPGNVVSFNDKEILDLTQQQDETLDTTKRKELVNQMERLLLQRGPYTVITWIKLGTALHPWVKNHFEPIGWYSGNQYDHIWLAK